MITLYIDRKQAEEQLEKLKEKVSNIILQHFDGDFTIETRIKSDVALERKKAIMDCQQQKGYKEIFDIPDIIGLRILTENENDCYVISEILNTHFSPSRIIDYFTQPRDTGFKAYLYFYTNLDIHSEIQIMTYQMRDWTNSTHKEHELRKYGNYIDEENKGKPFN